MPSRSRDATSERARDAGAVVEKIEGTVLSVNQGTVVLRAEDGLRFLSTRETGLRLPSLPDGLLTKPTLVWRVKSGTPGSHDVRTTYQTAGMTWRADYNVVLDAADRKADVSAWVSLLNVSGAGFRDARLKLIAGDVQRISPTERRRETWHPIVLEEMRLRDEEQSIHSARPSGLTAYVPLMPDSIRIRHEAHGGYSEPIIVKHIAPAEQQNYAGVWQW